MGGLDQLTSPFLMQILQAVQQGNPGGFSAPAQQMQRQNQIAQQPDPAFNIPGLQNFTPGLGNRAPWLDQNGMVNSDVLMQYAQAGHPTAVGQIQQLQNQGNFWSNQPVGVGFDPQQAMMQRMQQFMGGVSPEAVQAVMGFSQTGALPSSPRQRPNVVGQSGAQPNIFDVLGGSRPLPNIVGTSDNMNPLPNMGLPNPANLPGMVKPNASQPAATFANMPDPSTKILGGTPNNNPLLPKKNNMGLV